jgi:hypothetical protein
VACVSVCRSLKSYFGAQAILHSLSLVGPIYVFAQYKETSVVVYLR